MGKAAERRTHTHPHLLTMRSRWMLSRNAGRVQAFAAAGKFKTPSPSPQDTRAAGREQSTGPPDLPTCTEGIPHSCCQTLHPPLPPGRCTAITAHAQAWGDRSSSQSPQEVPCCHHQEAHSFSQTSSWEAEALVTLLPAGTLLGVSSSYCHLKPSPTSTGAAPSVALQEEELSFVKVPFALAGWQQTPPVQCYQAPI